jgi:hypothetical protein
MSHFVVAVITSKKRLSQSAIHEVEVLMAPYDENDEMFREGSRWDWYVIGGRWDGAMFGQKPFEIEVACDICNGTGKRDVESLAQTQGWGEKEKQRWLEFTNGCNGCMGEGLVKEYPNQYQDVPDRNAGKMSDTVEEFIPFAFVTPDGEWHETARMGWWGVTLKEDEFGNQEKEEEEWKNEWDNAKKNFADHIVFSLDCHV